MRVKDILINWLKANGYDGLCHPDIECGCGLNDFIPCRECFDECEPAYKTQKDGEDWYQIEKPK